MGREPSLAPPTLPPPARARFELLVYVRQNSTTVTLMPGQSTLGRSTIARSRPQVDSRGAIMQPPAAARAFVASITRALSEGDDKPKT